MMYPRTNYEMTQEQLDRILEACRSVPVMMIGGYTPSSPQENANAAWATLGQEMGFDYMTVKPQPLRGTRFFSAVPSETETQRAERLVRETEAKRLAEIATLTAEIAERQSKLQELRAALKVTT